MMRIILFFNFVHVTAPAAVYLLPVTIAGTIMGQAGCIMNLVNSAAKGNHLHSTEVDIHEAKACWI